MAETAPDCIAAETLRQFIETGDGCFLDNADADVLRDMVRLLRERSRGLDLTEAEREGLAALADKEASLPKSTASSWRVIAGKLRASLPAPPEGGTR